MVHELIRLEYKHRKILLGGEQLNALDTKRIFINRIDTLVHQTSLSNALWKEQLTGKEKLRALRKLKDLFCEDSSSERPMPGLCGVITNGFRSKQLTAKEYLYLHKIIRHELHNRLYTLDVKNTYWLMKPYAVEPRLQFIENKMKEFK